MYFNLDQFEADSHPANTCSSLPASTLASQSLITVLTSRDKETRKKFFLDDSGELQTDNFQHAFLFDAEAVRVDNIEELATLLQRVSAAPNKILIRGLHQDGNAASQQRQKANFPEHPDGTPWVMLDFDDIPLAEGIDPLSMAALDFVVAKLPAEFQNASYFYQFSNSAGILKADGTPKKAGLNAHLFFWLNRRVPGKQLNGYLQKHCLDTGFYEIDENKGGVVQLKYGIDPAPIRSAVQAHYVAQPEIGPGVQCQLQPGKRQGLVKKGLAEVSVPVLAADIEAVAQRLSRELTEDYKIANGYTLRPLQTKTAEGVSITWLYAKPGTQTRTGRIFTEGELSDDQQFFTLFFEDENSPGSWFVGRKKPQIAFHFGGEALSLKELSQSAHEYVRDQLGWFSEVPYHQLPLTGRGYLPALSDFATAKVSLVLAPTGSGKTKAAIDWMRDKSRTTWDSTTRLVDESLVIYAAPTIALVNQMKQDLATAELVPSYYRDVHRGNIQQARVIVTTNESLRRVLGLVYDAGMPHFLVLDEIHAGLDEFMATNQKNATLENALGSVDIHY